MATGEDVILILAERTVSGKVEWESTVRDGSVRWKATVGSCVFVLFDDFDEGLWVICPSSPRQAQIGYKEEVRHLRIAIRQKALQVALDCLADE